MGRVIPHLEPALQKWRNYQSHKTNSEWAFALHHAGFMRIHKLADVETMLEAATNSGLWTTDDPLTVAGDFLTAAKMCLVHDATDVEMHEAVALALYTELATIVGIGM